MITVTLIEQTRELELYAHYYYKDRLKSLVGSHFNSETKSWRIPVSSLYFLEQEFQGELFFQTPRWYIVNGTPPDYSKMYELSTSITVPKLKIPLYDYQQYGVKFLVDRLVNNGVCILSDGVGIGKTAQAIAAIKWMIENKKYRKILLVVKKSVKLQWVREFDKFTDLSSKFKIVATGDTPAKRKKAYDIAKDEEDVILITNFHNFLSDKDYINLIGFDMSCIDEVHQICGRTTKMNNAISYTCAGKPCIMMTGTPILSQPENIFGIMQIANPKYFGSYKDFKDRYLVEDFGQFGKQIVGAKNLDELRGKVQNVVLRRTEKEVSVSLPSVMINKITCTKDKVQESIIDAIDGLTQECNNEMRQLQPFLSDPQKKEKFDALDAKVKGFIAARQAAASDPRLFHMTNSAFMKKTFGKMVTDKYVMSDKTEKILSLVQEIVDSGYKVILFSKFWTSAKLISDDIQKHLKYKTLMYTGAESSQDVRDQNVMLFTQTIDHNVLIGTEALSEGVNLAEANYVINIDQPDTFAIKTQRIGRIRRVSSQFSTVTAYDMITENSKDEEALKNIVNNIRLTDALVNLTEEQSKALIAAMQNIA